MPLHRLLYRSEANLAGTDADVQQQIAEIVARAAAGNEAAGLTGALLYAGGMFVQALEGPPAKVEQTFERICCDHRHRRMELLEFVHAENRTFAEWSMARVTVDRQVGRLVTGVTIFDVPPAEEGMSAQATIHLLRSLLLADLDSAALADSPGPARTADHRRVP